MPHTPHLKNLHQAPNATMSETKTDPTKFLSTIIGSAVVVKLHNGVEYQGNLQSIDGYMNVVLDSAKELVGEVVSKNYGDVFIRGNNGMYFNPVRGTRSTQTQRLQY